MVNPISLYKTAIHVWYILGRRKKRNRDTYMRSPSREIKPPYTNSSRGISGQFLLLDKLNLANRGDLRHRPYGVTVRCYVHSYPKAVGLSDGQKHHARRSKIRMVTVFFLLDAIRT